MAFLILTSAGSTDVFVAKYTFSGQFIWAFRIGQNNRDGAMRVKINNAGEVLVTGFVRENNIDFDPGPGVFNLNAPGLASNDPGHSGDIFGQIYIWRAIGLGVHNFWAV